jgi:RNA polymerase sigma factor (TIGR02999 family)
VPDEHPSDITRLLHEWQEGDKRALEELMPLVYDELRHLASRYLSRERSNHTLQTTALVHEAYMKLAGQRRTDWQSRAHFYGIAAQCMRRILVDHARADDRVKRGRDVAVVQLDDTVAAHVSAPSRAFETLALDRALTTLEAMDREQGRIVELRYFGGLTIEETAAVMGTSPATVKREWAIARAWLYRELSGGAQVAT